MILRRAARRKGIKRKWVSTRQQQLNKAGEGCHVPAAYFRAVSTDEGHREHWLLTGTRETVPAAIPTAGRPQLQFPCEDSGRKASWPCTPA